jgi:hypothetical protein
MPAMTPCRAERLLRKLGSATVLERDQLPHDVVSLHVFVGYRVDREPYARRALIFPQEPMWAPRAVSNSR